MTHDKAKLRASYQSFRELTWKLATSKPETLGSYALAIESKTWSLEQSYLAALRSISAVESVLGEMDPRKMSDVYRHAIMDFESYLFFFGALLDIIAKVVPFFYGKHARKIPRRYFEGQRKWFTDKCPSFDQKYSSFLKENAGIFDRLDKHRNKAIHESVSLVGFGTDNVPSLMYFGSDLREDNVKTFLSESFEALFRLLQYYVDNFGDAKK